MANATPVEPIVPIGSETRNGHFTTPTQCTSQCSTCALLRRHVELRSPAKLGSTPENSREANGPSTPTRRRDPVPNPYITPPQQFVRLMLQRKRKDLDTFEGRASTRTTESPSPTPAPTRDKRHERVKKRHDQRQSREMQTPYQLATPISTLNSLSAKSATPGEVDDRAFDLVGDMDVDEDDGKSCMLSTPSVPQEHVAQQPLPKFSIGEQVLVTSADGESASQRKYGTLKVERSVHSDDLRRHGEKEVDLQDGWYYVLSWDVLDGIAWRPDLGLWSEDRLSTSR